MPEEYVNIDQLEDAAPLTGAEYIEAVQNGKNVRIRLSALASYLGTANPTPSLFPYMELPILNFP